MKDLVTLPIQRDLVFIFSDHQNLIELNGTELMHQDRIELETKKINRTIERL